jgi:hypothetical protein
MMSRTLSIRGFPDSMIDPKNAKLFESFLRALVEAIFFWTQGQRYNVLIASDLGQNRAVLVGALALEYIHVATRKSYGKHFAQMVHNIKETVRQQQVLGKLVPTRFLESPSGSYYQAFFSGNATRNNIRSSPKQFLQESKRRALEQAAFAFKKSTPYRMKINHRPYVSMEGNLWIGNLEGLRMAQSTDFDILIDLTGKEIQKAYSTIHWKDLTEAWHIIAAMTEILELN